MKKNSVWHLVLIVIVALTSFLSAKPMIKKVEKPVYIDVWQKIYGGKDDDIAEGIVALENGESAIVGTCKSFGAQRKDICVTRMDANGEMKWRLWLGGKKNDEGKAIARTADGNIVVLGRSKSFTKEYAYDLYVAKISLDGKKIWEKTLGGDRDEYPGGIAGTDDGGVLLVGASESYGGGDKDIYIAKLNKDGKLLNAHTIGGSKEDVATALTRTRDGKMVAVGYREVEYVGDSDFFIMQMDQNGKMRWRKHFGGTYEDKLLGVTATVDNGIVAIGSTRSYGSSQTDLTVMKIDAKGKTIWHKIYGFKYFEYGNAVATTRDGGFMLAGGTNTLGKGNHSVYVLALNRAGELIWSHVYGGERKDVAHGVARMSDGSMIVVGETESFRLTKKFYMIKLKKQR
jgi:outer membrane protein assembly factor BamB